MGTKREEEGGSGLEVRCDVSDCGMWLCMEPAEASRSSVTSRSGSWLWSQRRSGGSLAMLSRIGVSMEAGRAGVGVGGGGLDGEHGRVGVR